MAIAGCAVQTVPGQESYGSKGNWQHMGTDEPRNAIGGTVPIMDFVTPADVKAFQALPEQERRMAIRTLVEIELLGHSPIDAKAEA
jgi:hypothetical protein